MRLCYIVGAGDVNAESGTIKTKSDDFIICADGGYNYRNLFDREPDLVVGDYDSLGYIPEIERKIILPTEKDYTDMYIAADEGLKRGYSKFMIYGGMGGERADHSIANLQLLNFIATKGATGVLIHGNRMFTALKDGELCFDSESEGYISIFSLSDKCEGVTIKNLKYDIENRTINNYEAIGVSNEFIGKRASVSVKKGTLLITWNVTNSAKATF